jgi:hypothetical protein
MWSNRRAQYLLTVPYITSLDFQQNIVNKIEDIGKKLMRHRGHIQNESNRLPKRVLEYKPEATGIIGPRRRDGETKCAFSKECWAPGPRLVENTLRKLDLSAPSREKDKGRQICCVLEKDNLSLYLGSGFVSDR